MEDLNIIIVLLASLSLRLSSLSFDFKDIAYEQIHWTITFYEVIPALFAVFLLIAFWGGPSQIRICH